MFGSNREPRDDNMPTRFVRSSPQRATVGPLKQPKLPGAERFRFNRSTENLSAPPPANPIASSRFTTTTTTTPPNSSSASMRRRPTSPPPPIPSCATSPGFDRRRQSPMTTGYRQSSLRNPTTTEATTGPPFRQPVYYFQQNRLGTTSPSESSGRRKPVIPISKHTSRVLNNTNVELSADAIEFIKSETSRINNICKTYIVPTATGKATTTSKATPTCPSTSASNESDVDGSDSGASSLSSSSSARSSGCSLDRKGRFWLPGMTGGRRSPPPAAASTSSREDEFGGETVAVRNGSYVPVKYSPPAADPRRSVNGLATFRPRSAVQQVDDARTQSSGSLASVEGDDRNWMRIRRTRMGSSTGSPSPTQSVCSSDSNDNPWVLRTDCV